MDVVLALVVDAAHQRRGVVEGAAGDGAVVDRTIGIALGYAHLETPILSNETGLYEPWKRDAREGLPTGTFASNGIKAVARTGRSERDGLMGVLQYRPNKQWTSIVDVYASRFKQDETANQLEISLEGNGGLTPGVNYNPVTVNNGTIAGGTFNNATPLVRGIYNKRKDDIRAVGWSNEYKTQDFTIFADLNYSNAKRNELSLENNLQMKTAAGVPLTDSIALLYGNGGYSQLNPGRDYNNASSMPTVGTLAVSLKPFSSSSTLGTLP